MNNLLFTIITFYQFKKITNIIKFHAALKDMCKFNKIRGTIILAEEGINGTVAGTSNEIKLLESFLINKGFDNLQPKYSYYKYMPFFRLKVRIKKEIVTLRSNKTDPQNTKGNHINSQDWDDLIKNDKTVLIDVRNNFEHKVGTFKGSINPNTENFTEFKKFINKNLKDFKNKKIALFCTGGIRCEKASSYMIKKGFMDVNQLKGGVIDYLSKIPKKNSSWTGECFVFDNRVTVIHKLKQGTYELCHACRNPISKKDKSSQKYVKGISCPDCFGKISAKKKKALNERNKQIQISKSKGLYNPYLKYTPSDLY
tara:strand:+ start:570 stop:1505 length:936 start_codon:yes stop_codon:yes gene_type:complete